MTVLSALDSLYLWQLADAVLVDEGGLKTVEVNNTQAPEKDSSETLRVVTEMVFCPAHGRRIPVTFKLEGKLFPHRVEVVDCPEQKGEPCDLPCLRPIGGAPFA